MAEAVASANRQERAQERKAAELQALVHSLNEVASKHDLEVPPMSVEEFVRGDYLDGVLVEDDWGLWDGDTEVSEC